MTELGHRPPHVEIYRGRDQGRPRFRVRLVGENGEKVAGGQGYTRRWSARQGARRAFGQDVEIRDLTKRAPA